MSKKPSIVAIAMALLALLAVTAALALSSKPKLDTHNAVVATTASANTARPAAAHISKQDPGDGDGETNDDHEGNDGDTEQDDDGNLTASITPGQATAAALAAQPGTAGKVELENEDEKTVYGFEVTAADGKKYDVKVDANTGKVLKIEADDEDEGGDGDGETNDDSR